MTVELTSEHSDIANEASERIRALIAAPLMHAAETAAQIFSDSIQSDSE